jgi:hypothetical protein
MIDRRNISYTQGTPNTPIHKGELVVKSSRPNQEIDKLKRGTVISTSGDKYIDGILVKGKTEKEKKSFAAKNLPWYAYTPAGYFYHTSLSPVGAIKTLFFSEPDEQKERLAIFGEVIGATERGKITDFGEKIKGAGTLPATIEKVGSATGWGKWLIYGGLALIGLWIGSKVLGGKR